MKKTFLFLSSILIANLLFSQEYVKSKSEKWNYGFNFGVNHTQLVDKYPLPSNAKISNNFGFQLGMLAEYQLNNWLSITPKSDLAFNNGSIKFLNIDNSESVYSVLPISLNLMVHLMVKKSNKALKPYLFFGPNIKIPVSRRPVISSSFYSNPDLAFDMGVGLQKAFRNFILSPELKYSYGFANVNQNPALLSLYIHQLSLVFNFMKGQGER